MVLIQKMQNNYEKNIKDFCLNNNIPNEFISDNGPEFKNRLFNKFYKNHNIKFLYGAPYSSHNQGIVERFNYTIKKYLCKEFIANNNQNLVFENIKFKIINFYNNKKQEF